MAELDTTWCDLGEMEAYMCACRIHAKIKGLKDITQPEAANWNVGDEWEVVARTSAKFSTHCPACKERVQEGDLLVKLDVYDGWIHEHCTPGYEEPYVAPLALRDQHKVIQEGLQ